MARVKIPCVASRHEGKFGEEEEDELDHRRTRRRREKWGKEKMEDNALDNAGFTDDALGFEEDSWLWSDSTALAQVAGTIATLLFSVQYAPHPHLAPKCNRN